MEKKILSYMKKIKKEHIIVCMLVGVLLVIIALPVKEKEETNNIKEVSQDEHVSTTDTNKGFEKQLEEVLEEVEGVGQVKVVITYETDGEKVVEKDIPTSETESQSKGKEGTQESSTSKSTEETTIYQKDSEGNEIPYVIANKTPLIRGVLVVAEGGDNPVTIQNIQEAVRALFQVEPHKIKVMKMK